VNSPPDSSTGNEKGKKKDDSLFTLLPPSPLNARATERQNDGKKKKGRVPLLPKNALF
jgi:hypothetical protein